MIDKLKRHFVKIFIFMILVLLTGTFLFLRSEYFAVRAHQYLLQYLEEGLQSEVEMDRPRIEWLKGNWHIRNIAVRPRLGKEKREFLKAGKVNVSFFPWWNVLNKEIGIRSVKISNPSVYLRLEEGRVVNLPSMNFFKGKGIFNVSISEIEIDNGSVIVEYPEKGMEAVIGNIGLKGWPELDERRVALMLSGSTAQIRVGEAVQKVISLSGEFLLTPEGIKGKEATLVFPQGTVSLNDSSYEFSTGRYSANLSGKADLASLGKYMERPSLSGKADIRVKTSGSGTEFNMKGEAKSPEFAADGFGIKDTVVKFSAKGSPKKLEEASYDFEINTTVPAEMAGYYSAGVPAMKGAAVIRLSGSGRYKELTAVEGKIRSSRLEIADIPASDISGDFRWGKDSVSVTGFSAMVFDGRIAGDVEAGLKGERSFAGNFTMSGVDLNNLTRSIVQGQEQRYFGAEGRLSGDVTLKGLLAPVFSISGSIDIKADDAKFSQGNWIDLSMDGMAVRTEFEYQERSLKLSSFRMESPAATILASGTVSKERMLLSIEMASSDLEKIIRDVKGSGKINLTLIGPAENPGGDGNLVFNEISWKGYRADTIQGRIGFVDKRIFFHEMKIAKDHSELLLKGDVSLTEDAPVVDASLRMERGRLEDIASLCGIVFPLEGSVSVSGEVKGRLDRPDGLLFVKSEKLTLAGEAFDSIVLDGRLDGGRLYLEKGEILRSGERLDVSGEVSRQGDLALELSTTPLSLQNFIYMRKNKIPLRGTLKVWGRLEGRVGSPTFNGTALLNEIKYRDISLGNGEITLSLIKNKLGLTGPVFGLQMSGEAVLSEDMPFNVKIEADGISLTPFFGLQETRKVTGDLSGVIEAEGELANPAKITAKGRMSSFRLIREPYFVVNRGDVIVEISDGRVIFQSFNLTGKGTELKVTGWMGLDGEMSLYAEGNAELSIVEMFTNILDKGAGVADVKFSITGKPPRIDGKINLKEGMLSFRNFDQIFSDIDAEFTLKGDSLVMDRLSGRMGDGKFKGEGTILLSALELKRTDLAFELAGLNLTIPSWLPSELSGTLLLAGEYPSLLLSGEMNVQKATYSERIDWKSLLVSFRQRVEKPVKLREKEAVLRFDIGFKAERNIIFDSNVGKAELKGDIRLKGDTNRLGLVGEVEVIGGKALYKEHEFKIISGVIEFPDPKKIETVYDFVAEAKVRDYIIQIHVQGNSKDAKVAMTSIPSLTELDIVALLTVGLTSEEFAQSEEGATAYEAAAIVSREMEGKFKDYIGLDRFHIDPYYSKTTGTTEPKLSAGKELSDNLSVTLSRSLSSATEQEIQMEYKLFRNFSILGGWSSFGGSETGDVGADVKFRFEFR